MNQQLMEHREKLTGELRHAEEELNNWRVKCDDLRKKVNAIDTLLSEDLPETGDDSETMRVDPGEPTGTYAPVDAYWSPILLTLVELGGKGRSSRVREIVGERMKGTLTPEDYKKLRNSNFIRWENRVAWQVSNMRQQGLIKKSSSRGVWEITDDGRKWLDDKKKNA